MHSYVLHCMLLGEKGPFLLQVVTMHNSLSCKDGHFLPTLKDCTIASQCHERLNTFMVVFFVVTFNNNINICYLTLEPSFIL